jgi:preprotein translocase subunit Sec63
VARPVDPYEVLGLPRTASPDAIRARYKELVARYHPDRHVDNPLAELASEKLRDINWAYEALMNEASTAPKASIRSQDTEPADELTLMTKRIKRTLVGGLVALLLVRFGVVLVRVVIGVASVFLRFVIEIVSAGRGTPLGAVLVFLLIFGFVALHLKRRKRT